MFLVPQVSVKFGISLFQNFWPI